MVYLLKKYIDSMDFSQGGGDAISETLLEQAVETGSSFLQAAITVKPYSETYEKNSGIVEGNKEKHKLMAEASVRDPRVYGLGHLYGNVAIMTKGVVEVIRGAGTAVGGVALTGGSLVADGATYGAAAPAVAVSWGAVGVGGGLIVDGALSVGNGYENSKESIRLIQNAGGGRGERTSDLVFKVGSKADALQSLEGLPDDVAANVKRFIKKSGSGYTEYAVEILENGNYQVKMLKPGDVSGYAEYYKILDPSGTTIETFKDTFDNFGNLVHRKYK